MLFGAWEHVWIPMVVSIEAGNTKNTLSFPKTSARMVLVA